MVDTPSDAGRVVYAGLSLLDRQLLDREGRPCGNVDDLEVTISEDTGEAFVTAILAGPGMLAYRLGWRRWGRWVHRVNTVMSPLEGDPNRIPMERVSEIGPAVQLAVQHDELGTAGLDKWAREHITSRIPGGEHAAE